MRGDRVPWLVLEMRMNRDSARYNNPVRVADSNRFGWWTRDLFIYLLFYYYYYYCCSPNIHEINTRCFHPIISSRLYLSLQFYIFSYVCYKIRPLGNYRPSTMPYKKQSESVEMRVSIAIVEYNTASNRGNASFKC